MNDLKFTTAGDYVATPSMNTVLARLSQETDIWCDQNWSDHPLYDVYWEAHFAQLIVRECIEVASKYDEPKLSGPGLMIGQMITQHFEVEE
jgi:hypothetical protein